MKPQHTPWKFFTNLSASENHKGFKVVDADGYLVANVSPRDEDGVEGMQNARLISSAPDLLDALEKLARLGNGNEYGNSEGNMIARAAIRKATGVE